MLKIKSIYDKAHEQDGKRYLVERFWPEGVHTHLARIDAWLTELGPSYDLQRFEFDKSNWQAYSEKYRQELLQSADKKALLQRLAQEAKAGAVTLLYGNNDATHNHAAIVKEIIENQSN